MASTANSGDPTLTLPASEQVTADGTVAVTGASYTDSFAQSNPGAMYLGISDASGVLCGFYPGAGGTTGAPGDGSNSIVFQGSYADVQDIINSLTYVATTAGGSDSIAYDIWNQAGVQTTGTIPVTIGGSSGVVTETWTGAVSSDWNTPGNWSGNAVPASGDTAVIAGGTPNFPALAGATLNDETIVVDQIPQQQGNTLDLDNVTLGAGSVLDIQNPSGASQSFATIDLAGTVTIDAGATVVSNGSVNYQALTSSGANVVLVNDGTIDDTAVSLTNGGTAVNNGVFENQAIGAPTLINAGTILADDAGTMVMGTAVGGTAEIANSVGLTVNGALSGTAVDFDGPGILVLQQPAALANGTAIDNFGTGDEIILTGSALVTGSTLAFSNHTLTVLHDGSTVETIPFNGNDTLGNFVIQLSFGTPVGFAYAPSGGYSGLYGYGPDIAAPAQAAVAQGGTLSLGSVAIQNTTSFDTTVSVSAASGTLSMNGATGSGTDSLTFTGSNAQVNADLATLTYTPAAGTSSDAVQVIAYIDYPSAVASAERFVPVSVNASSGPALNEPAAETVAAGGSVAVSGSYTDSFAESNPGSMYLGISDSSGTLLADYSGSGGTVAAPGSGSDSIVFNGSYQDVEQILNNLTYVAGAAGSDNIQFDIWNQAGVRTTDTVPVTISGSSGGGTTETWTGAVSSDWNTAANWSGNAVPTAGDTVMIFGNTPNDATLSNATLNGETVILQRSGNSAPVVNLNNVTLNSVLESGNAGSVNIGGTLTIGAQGTVMADANASLQLGGTGEAVVNDGLIASAAGGDVTFYDRQNQPAGATLVNNGSIDAAGFVALVNTADLPGSAPDWQVTNAGGVTIQNGGAFEVNGTVSGGTIGFNGTGALSLEQIDAVNGVTVSGFGQGDQIDLYSGAQGTLEAFNDGTLYIGTGTGSEPIALTGSFALGNFQESTASAPGDADIVAYAPAGGTSGIVSPGIVTPAQDSVAQGATLILNDVSLVAQNGGTISSTGTYSLAIDAGSGTLFMNGASGSGTNALSVAGTAAQVNADLSTLRYVPAASASTDTIGFHANFGMILSNRWLPITVTAGSASGPALNEPASETVSENGTVAVTGSYTDSFAQSNPGDLYIGISDSSGTLTATNAAGQAVAGSGTHQIALSADYVDVNAILASLHYTAGPNAGSDTISFDVWNQAGVETTGATAMTIDPPTQGASMTMADFASPNSSGVGGVMPSYDTGGAARNLAMADTPQHQIGMPLALNPGS